MQQLTSGLWVEEDISRNGTSPDELAMLEEQVTRGYKPTIPVEGMYNAEKAGYPVIGTVHDEIITLRDAGTGDIKALELLVCDVPEWADGMPLASKGFVCERYKKD